jgi:serine/threonine protein kinase
VHSADLERDDRLVGTLAYMAPELRDGQDKPSPRSDLYSIGVILVETLTGERPAGAELPSSVRPDVPTALDEVYRRLYARQDCRYESAHAVLDDLDARLATVRPLHGGPPPPPPPGWKADGAAAGALRACSACNRLVAADDQFCTYCGHQLTSYVRRCPACRGYPAARDRFCIFCGAALPLEE